MLTRYELSVLASVADGEYDHDTQTLDRLKAEGYICGNLRTLGFELTDKGRTALSEKVRTQDDHIQRINRHR